MALKRLPVLFFFVAESTANGPAAAQKRAAGGEWNGKKRTQKSVALEICM